MSSSDAPRFYSTDGLGTEVYDAVTEVHIARSSVEGDVDFFRAMAEQIGGPVLEVGCGTGRVTFALAADGFEVVGLDLSAPMLKQAEARKSVLPNAVSASVSFVQADMSSFDLGRTFSLIVVPFRVFQFLLTVETQRSALSSMRRHLKVDGRLVLDLFDPRLDLCAPPSLPPGPIESLVHPSTGNVVQIQRLDRRNDPATQVFIEHWRSTELDLDGTILRTQDESVSLRWTYRWEMRHLLELEGYEIEAEYGDFLGSAPVYGGEQVWVVRVRP
ncbi:MAG: class I SAM-dependent methyltransferase [Chloroflexota bacterium]